MNKRILYPFLPTFLLLCLIQLSCRKELSTGAPGTGTGQTEPEQLVTASRNEGPLNMTITDYGNLNEYVS